MRKSSFLVSGTIVACGVFIAAGIIFFANTKDAESKTALQWKEEAGAGLAVPACTSSASSITCENGVPRVDFWWNYNGSHGVCDESRIIFVQTLWKQKTASTASGGNSAPAFGVISNKLYVAQGSQWGGTGYVYDPATDDWDPIASAPAANVAPASAVANRGGTPRLYSFGTATHEYTPSTNSWITRGGPRNIPVADMTYGQAATVSDIVYVFKGLKTYSYDPNYGLIFPVSAWRERKALPRDHYTYPAVAEVGGKIYVIGGWNGTVATAATDAYDPVTNTWTSKADRPGNPVGGATAVAVGTDIYVFGGIYWDGADYVTSALMHKYDTVTNTWTIVYQGIITPTARAASAMGFIDGNIYLVGGQEYPWAYPNDTWEFPPTPPNPLPAPITGLPCVDNVDQKYTWMGGAPNTEYTYYVQILSGGSPIDNGLYDTFTTPSCPALSVTCSGTPPTASIGQLVTWKADPTGGKIRATANLQWGPHTSNAGWAGVAANQTILARRFYTSRDLTIGRAVFQIAKDAAVTAGTFWVTVEENDAGVPSGIPLPGGTSFDVKARQICTWGTCSTGTVPWAPNFDFQGGTRLKGGNLYWLVLRGRNVTGPSNTILPMSLSGTGGIGAKSLIRSYTSTATWTNTAPNHIAFQMYPMQYSFLWGGDAPLAGKISNPAIVSYPDSGLKSGDVTVTSGTETEPASCGTVDVLPNNAPVAVASISTDGVAYAKTATVLKGEPVSIWLGADQPPPGSYDPDGWTDPVYGVSSGGGKCEWNSDLNPIWPSPPGTTIGNPASPTVCNTGPLAKTFNDVPGTYTYPALQITDKMGASSPIDTVSVHVTAPNLVTESPSYSPASPAIGDLISFSATVRNAAVLPDAANAKASEARLQIDLGNDGWTPGEPEFTNPTSALTPSGTELETWTDIWTAVAGNHSYQICADSGLVVTESNELDNCTPWLSISFSSPVNLTIETPDYDPDNPVVGNPMTFSATVRNTGTADAIASETRLRIDVDNNGVWSVGEPEFTNATGALTPGDFEDEIWSNIWTAIAGDHNYEICADSGGVVIESNEGDNCTGWLPFSVSNPDLVSVGLGFTPAIPREGDTMIFSGTIRNQGTTPAGASIARFCVDSLAADNCLDLTPPYGTVVGEPPVPPLAKSGDPGDRAPVLSSPWDATFGPHRFYLCADAGQAVAESQESNNCSFLDFGVLGRPDLIGNDIIINGFPGVGNSITFSSTAMNQGSDTTGASFNVRFCVDNAACLTSTAGRVGGDITTPALGAGATSPTITSASWIVTTGSHTVYFCADVGAAITESEEGNNCSIPKPFRGSIPTFREIAP